MKKLFTSILILILGSLAQSAFADTAPAQPAQNTTATSPYTNSNNCSQNYPISSEKLFFLTLASINANNFQAQETQTRGGFILFNAGKKQFLATIAKIDENTSIIKVAPADNSYYFSPSIINNLFYYITLNLEAQFTTVIKGK